MPTVEVNTFYLFTLTGKLMLEVRKLMHTLQDCDPSVLTTQSPSYYRILPRLDYLIFHLTFLTKVSISSCVVRGNQLHAFTPDP